MPGIVGWRNLREKESGKKGRVAGNGVTVVESFEEEKAGKV